MSSDAGKSYVYISGSGEYSMAYRYLEYVEEFSQRIRLNIITIIVLFLLNCSAFDHCIPTYGGYSFPQLNKLENATYARSHSFMGKSVDVYSYDVSSKN